MDAPRKEYVARINRVMDHIDDNLGGPLTLPERAAIQLVADLGRPITTIALECGFSGSAPFARAFRDASCTGRSSRVRGPRP